MKSESCSDICNAVDEEIPFIEEIKPYYSNLNRNKSECHSDNIVDSNYNIKIRLGNKEL